MNGSSRPASGAGSGGSIDSNNSNLFTDFEAAYSSLVSTVVSEDSLYNRDADVLKMEEEKFKKFMDVARSLENFFLQKRQLIHVHKPELILKEETLELKHEIQRKDELIRKHFEKLNHWQDMLQDMQSSSNVGTSANPTSSASGPATSTATGQAPGGIPQARPVMPVPGAPMQPGVGAPQGGFVPGNNYRTQQPGAMQDPLSYLEKATTSVGPPHMSR